MKMHFHPWWRTKFMKTPVKFLLSPFAYFACFAVKIPRLSFCVLLCAFVAINSRAPASSTPTAHGLTQRRKDATAQRAEVESGDFLRGGRPRDFPRCGFLLSVVPITAFDFALCLCAPVVSIRHFPCVFAPLRLCVKSHLVAAPPRCVFARWR